MAAGKTRSPANLGAGEFRHWHGYRLMTRGFEEKTFYGEPYNKIYWVFLAALALPPERRGIH
jgi:hypothetical protein